MTREKPRASAPRSGPDRSEAARFVRDLSHDITNPLMAISGLAEIVLRSEKSLSLEARKRLEQVVENCDRIAVLLRSRLAGTNRKAGRGPGNDT